MAIIQTQGISKLTLAKGNKQAFIAMGHYSDGSSKVLTNLNVNAWHSSDKKVGFFSEPNILLAGNTAGTVSVYVTQDGITSNTIDVNVFICRMTGSSCIDVFDTGSGTLFTNSPSEIYLNSIGGSENNGFTQEIGTSGPTGNFSWFEWQNASKLCNTYKTVSLAGRTNWRLAKKDELVELFNTYGNMFTARGWAVRLNYWSATSRGPGFLSVNLKNGSEGASMPDNEFYASCISNP